MNNSKINTESKLRSIEEASDYLGIKNHAFKNAFYNIYNKQSPKAVRIGKRIYFTEQALNDFVKQNEVTEAKWINVGQTIHATAC